MLEKKGNKKKKKSHIKQRQLKETIKTKFVHTDSQAEKTDSFQSIQKAEIIQ